MIQSRPGRYFALSVLILFTVFTFRDTLYAKRPPNVINLKIELKAKIQYKKERGQAVPVAMIINGRSYDFVKQGGKWGIKAPLKDILENSQECREAVHLAVGEIVRSRISELIGGDRAKAEEFVRDFKALQKKAPESELPWPGSGPFSHEDASAAVYPASSSQDFTRQSMVSAYNQMLNSEAFLYPQVQPDPQSGWWFVSEQEGGGEAEDDEELGLFGWLGVLLIVLAVLVAPIVAAVWVATTAITLASLAIAAMATMGAQLAASILTGHLLLLDHVMMGKPLIEIYN
jgi:hypothetical protein